MTDDLTSGLDLLGDWLDAKGYTEEAGLCTRVMDYMHKQDKRIRDLHEIVRAREEDCEHHRVIKIAAMKIADERWEQVKKLDARIAALEAENEQLKQELKRWRVTLNQTGEEAMMPEGWSHRNDGWR